MAAMSSAQIVSASAIHNKMGGGLAPLPPGMGPTYPPYGSQVQWVSFHCICQGSTDILAFMYLCKFTGIFHFVLCSFGLAELIKSKYDYLCCETTKFAKSIDRFPPFVDNETKHQINSVYRLCIVFQLTLMRTQYCVLGFYALLRLQLY